MTYWYNSTKDYPKSKAAAPSNEGILIIGSGLAGVSTAYFLIENGFSNVKIVDCGTEGASYFRNAGHMLHGVAESYAAVAQLYGREKAKDLFKLSESFIDQYDQTIKKLNLECEYHKGDYFFVGNNSEEEQQLQLSVAMMVEDGFTHSRMVEQKELEMYGFKQAQRISYASIYVLIL